MVAGSVDAEQTGVPDFGPYRVQELLGQGGMGMVHRAYDTVHRRVIALKRLPATVDQDFRARFRREARIVANLSHPNVIPVNDFGEINGQLYLDMMLVDGIDLRRALGTGMVDQDQAIGILTQVAHALDAAHADGLVHRDVKPSNILVDREGHAYLADFGIARATSPEETSLTSPGELVGSWDYMAPERLSGGQVDGRADQYSLACVLFECLTGRLPHPAADPAAKVAAHLLQPPPAPSVFVPTITPALDEVVMRGMAKDPERRFPTVTALMAAALAGAYSGDTAKDARPTTPWPEKERDQGRLVRAILRSTAVRRPTRRIGHDYPPTCPYPGLRGFESVDAEWFHGRDHVVTDLLVRLAEQLDTSEPVVLVGASGSGKSSVLRAGLLPALAAADQPEQSSWPQIVLTPGADPVSSLALAVAEHASIAAAEWARIIRESPNRFGSLCSQAIGDGPVRPVIVVDQFEELFTHGTSEADRLAFATALAHANPALVLLAVRADMVERCIELSPLLPALNSPVLLGAMDSVELRQAIVAPARDAGVEVEPGLTERLIADLGVRGELGYDPGALPRLAHALRETWYHSDGQMLTLAAYRAVGGIDGAVARTAEEVYARFDPAGRQALRTLLLRLVTVFDDGGVARRRVDPRDLVAMTGHSGVLDALIAARLVTVDDAGARLAHEALLTAWPRLRDWIDEDRAGLVQHRRLTEAVRTWTESGGQADDLYRGVRLATLNTWLESARDRVRLHPAEQDFLARSNAAEQAGALTARRRTRRLRTLVLALSVLLVVATVAVVVATKLRQDAQNERNRADDARQVNLSRQLAAESALAGGIDPRRTALSALGAWEAGQTVEARSALLALQTDHYRGRMTGHDGPVSSVAISDDGRIAASGGRDGTLRLWDVPTRRQLTVLNKVTGGWYRTVSLSRDGKFLAASNILGAKTAVWNVSDRKIVFTVPVSSFDARISPDGTKLAAYIATGIAIYDLASGNELVRFPAANSLAMAYSPDGTLVANSNHGNVEVHRVADGALVANLTGHTDDVSGLSFDTTAPRLASSAADGTIRVWDMGTWTTRQVLHGDAALTSVVFSPRGDAVIGSGIGTTIYVWEPNSGGLLLRLATGAVAKFGLAMTGDGHTLLVGDADGVITRWVYGQTELGAKVAAVTGVALQRKGKLIATVSGNGAVQLWDATTGDLVRSMAGHTAAASEAAFSPDDTELATVGSDAAVIVWDVATGKEKRRYTGQGVEFSSVKYSPDGATIAVGGRTPVSLDKNDSDQLLLLRAKDLALISRRPTRQEPRNWNSEDAPVNYPNGLSFSPDGRTLAAALAGGRIVLWNLVDPGAELTTLRGHDDIAADVQYSPDGTMLASAGADKLVKLWRVRDGQLVGEFRLDSGVRRLAFSPDGATLATASQDTVLRLWDVRSGQTFARLDRHDDDLNDVAFDSGGQKVVSASADGTARIWDLDPDRAVRTVCTTLDPGTLTDEWRALGPDRGNPPTCPN